MGRTHIAGVVVLTTVALSCSPGRPDPVEPLDIRSRTGNVVAIDRGALLFVLPGRALWTAHLTSDARFENGTLSDIDAIAAANLDGYAVDATIRGVELGGQQVRALTIAADPVATAEPFLPISSRGVSVVGGTTESVPLLLDTGARWHYIVTAWTDFDPTGDYTSVAAIIEADRSGESVWIEGEGAQIGQQLTLFRRARAFRGPVS